jgi:acyl-CoA thioesterase-1
MMHRMSKPGVKALGILVAVAALLVVAGLWYDAHRLGEPDTSSSEAVPSFEPATPMRAVRLAVIGDDLSYSPAGSPQLAWPVLLTNERRWYLNNQATPGTGYVAGGSVSFTDRVAGAGGTSPDVIVVAGGGEDERESGLVQPRASRLYSDLQRVIPEATIVVVGPIGKSPAPSPNLRAVNEAVRLASDQAGIEFVEALDWLATPGLVQSNGRPTAAGDRLITDRIAAVLPDWDEVPA